MEPLDIEIATDQEAPACLALLPEVKGAAVELLVARRAGALVGAAALAWESWTTPAGFPTMIRVLPSERRQGVGRALLAAAADLAGEETDGLWSYTYFAKTGEASAFLQACGFTSRLRQHHFESTVAALLAALEPMTALLRARGSVPEDLRIIDLAEAPMDDISRLVSAGLGGGPDSALQGLAARVCGGAPVGGDRSQVLMCGAQVVGVVLWRVTGGVAVVDGKVVHPQFRGGWPNAILMEAGLLRAREEEVERFCFHCDETVKDTLALARRCAAVETETKAAWYYAVAAD